MSRFYEELAAGSTVGEALQTARRNELFHALPETPLTGAAFRLLGDPGVKIF